MNHNIFLQIIKFIIVSLQETLTEVIPRLNVIRDKLFVSQNQFSKLCDPMYLEQLKEKMSDMIIRLANTEKRLRLCQGSEVNIFYMYNILEY